MTRDTTRPTRPRRKAKARKRPEALPEYRVEDFFVLRSPLLPMDEYQRFISGLEDRSEADRFRALEARLLRLARRPEIAEALFVASPSLIESLERGEELPAKKAARLRQSLARYLLRMMTRATPFGLFAGVALGEVGDRTELSLGSRASYRLHTRLDMNYLDRLVRDLERSPILRPRLIYQPNSSLYRIAGRWRYAEGRVEGEKRVYHLVAARDDEFLAAAIEAARGGASLQTIARQIAARDSEGEIGVDEAEEFVHELIDAQLLVSDLGPRVTGREPIYDLIDRLAKLPEAEPIVRCLAGVRDDLESLDASESEDGALGSPTADYRRIGRRLQPLGTEVQMARLFQVDMSKPGGGLHLGPAVVDEVRRAIAFLHRLRGPASVDQFATFREDFHRRYEPGRWVPLVEVLDEEIGIGYQRVGSIGADNSPLLQGLEFPVRAGVREVPWGALEDLVARKVFDAARAGRAEIVWTDDDLQHLGDSAPKPLYSALQVIFSLTASTPEAIDRGDFRILLKGISGPSSAVLLGRFCHGDERLAESLSRHLRSEEANNPDAIYAEIVHLPEGRIGNILLRPLLRDHEIPFLGHSGADEARQVPITDLQVTVLGDEVMLFSKRLGRRIIPRLASAHNFSLRGLGIYRFLGALQTQGSCGGLTWFWGPLESLPALPRVVYGRTVLSPAQWRVESEEWKGWSEASGEARRRKLEAWRDQRQLPRQVLLADGDNELFTDFDNPLSVDAFLSIVKNRRVIRLVENLQDVSSLVVESEEGRFTHEIVLPFVRRADRTTPDSAPSRRWRGTAASVPVHIPGSEWIYTELFTGSATADGILEEVAPELLSHAGRGVANWFFLRYSDPSFHLRLRFRIPDPDLRSSFRRQLSQFTTRLVNEGRVWDVRFATYKPEVERYGGPEGLPWCEQMFQADSEAALAMLPWIRGDSAVELRWLAALASTDTLLAVLLGSDLEARIACLDRMKQGFAEEFGMDAALRRSIGRKLREKRTVIESALSGQAAPESPLAQIRAALFRRDERIEPAVVALRKLESDGRLSHPLSTLVSSLAHMTVNRLLVSEARAHEMVLYDFLHRHLLSSKARRQADHRPPKPVVAKIGGSP